MPLHVKPIGAFRPRIRANTTTHMHTNHLLFEKSPEIDSPRDSLQNALAPSPASHRQLRMLSFVRRRRSKRAQRNQSFTITIFSRPRNFSRIASLADFTRLLPCAGSATW